jgi:hypothetical protein
MTDEIKPLPRGLRNNNPGNVRVNLSIKWRGQIAVDQDGYLVFADAIWGLRAICMIIRHYTEYHGDNTVRKIISRWAPPSENPTFIYVGNVARACGVAPDDPFDIHQDGLTMLRAIVVQENGYCPYTDDVLNKAIDLSHIQ